MQHRRMRHAFSLPGLVALGAWTAAAPAAPPADTAKSAPPAKSAKAAANAAVVSPYARAAAEQHQAALLRQAAGGTGHVGAPANVQAIGRPPHKTHKPAGIHP